MNGNAIHRSVCNVENVMLIICYRAACIVCLPALLHCAYGDSSNVLIRG